MKTSLIIILVLSACLISSVRSASQLQFSSSDTSTTLFPLTVTPSSGSAASVTSGTQTAITPIPTTALTYTARFQSAGIPLNQVWVLTGEAAGAYGTVITVTLGPQVSLSVVGTVSNANTYTVGTAQTSASAVSISATTCGAYFIDCMAGTLTFQMGTTNAAGATCTVTINQVAAIAGILQYPTSSVSATAAATAVTSANGATSAATSICATTTSGTNTLLYFISTYGTATGTDQTTAYNKVRAAAVAGSLNSNTAYYTTNLQPSIAGGNSAPSSAASNLSTVNKSSNRLVVVAGLFTTAIATLFGFAL